MRPYRAQCIPIIPERVMSDNRRRDIMARNPEKYNMPEDGKATRMYQCTINEALTRPMLAILRETQTGQAGDPVRLVETKTMDRESDWNYREQRRHDRGDRVVLTPAVQPKKRNRPGRRQRLEALAATRAAEAETQPLHEQSKPEDKNKDGPVFDKDWTAVDDVARVRPSRAPGVIDMETSSGDLEEVLLRSMADEVGDLTEDDIVARGREMGLGSAIQHVRDGESSRARDRSSSPTIRPTTRIGKRSRDGSIIHAHRVLAINQPLSLIHI